MLPNYTIGLNETRVGIVAPPFFEVSFLSVLPQRIAERALMQGTMFTTDDALRVGLIDEIADDDADGLRRCAAYLEQYRAVVPAARAMSKQSLRRQGLDELRNNREHDVDRFLLIVKQPKAQAALGQYLAKMKKK